MYQLTMNVLHFDEKLAEIVCQILTHTLGECRDKHSLSSLYRLLISWSRSSICPSTGRTSITGSRSPWARITCSIGCRRALTHTAQSCGDIDSLVNVSFKSAKVSGRLSSALGNRNPCSHEHFFLALSPLYMPRSCGMVMCDHQQTAKNHRESSRVASLAARPVRGS